MPARRTAVAGRTAVAAGALVAAAALGGCSKPTPLVTLASGAVSVTSEPQVYCFGRAVFPAKGCVQHLHTPPVLTVRPGGLVGVDVPREVAHGGWFVFAGGRRTPVHHGRHDTLPLAADGFSAGQVELQVRALGAGGQTVRGSWVFRLRAG